MARSYSWDLEKFPNYDASLSVEVVEAKRLDEFAFRKRYVLQNRPCLIKGAVNHWPAHRRWSDPDYVLSKIGDVKIKASCSPKVERFGLRSSQLDRMATEITESNMLPAEEVREIWPRLQTPDDEVLFIELRPSERVSDTVCSLEKDLLLDGQRFPFFPFPPKPRFLYTPWATMFYKNSYSDWHFHPGTDAIMCQALGVKKVLLLPPDQRSWDQIVPIHTQEWKVYDIDLNKFPNVTALRPYRVVVEPGDGLFIPVNWWHAVQAYPQQFGATIPLSWDSPYRDLRQPATRHFLRKLWRAQKPLAAKVLIEATYGTIISQVKHPI